MFGSLGVTVILSMLINISTMIFDTPYTAQSLKNQLTLKNKHQKILRISMLFQHLLDVEIAQFLTHTSQYNS